jgi:hypothetical protein
MAVESVFRLVSFVSLQIPVYITTLSHVHFAMASEELAIAEPLSTELVIWGVTISAALICFLVGVFVYFHRISEKELPVELDGDDIDREIVGVAGGRSGAAVGEEGMGSSDAVEDEEAYGVTSANSAESLDDIFGTM